MQFLAFIAIVLIALAHNASAAVAKTKSPTSNCPVPPKGCSSQATLYSCTNPLYFGCEWTCGPSNKWCGAAYNDARFPEYGTPNQNRKCASGKVCCTAKKNCLMTKTPTLEPTQQPTLEPTSAPTAPTQPSKQPTKEPTFLTKTPTQVPTFLTKTPTQAPTNRCLPQPILGCTGIKPHTKLQCLGANFNEFTSCCTWTQNVDPKDPSKEIAGGVCTNK